MKNLSNHLLAILFVFLIPYLANACTAFCINTEQGVFAAKSYDWHMGQGYLISNNRGLSKTSYAFNMAWTSKYGSITFNQYGKEFPVGGMNEAGLVMEVLWLDETEYDKTGRKGLLNEIEFVQYQLDNFRTVDEAIAALDEVGIIPIAATLHYFIADENGNSAVIDFINGAAVVNRMENNNQCITNNSYQYSADYAKSNVSDASCRSSLCRYNTTFTATKTLAEATSNPIAISQLFGILDDVKIKGYTKWNIVYDISNRQIHFRTNRAKGIKIVNVADFDLSPEAVNLSYFVNRRKSGNVTAAFEVYTDKENIELIRYAAPRMEIKINAVDLNNHQMKNNNQDKDSQSSSLDAKKKAAIKEED